MESDNRVLKLIVAALFLVAICVIGIGWMVNSAAKVNEAGNQKMANVMSSQQNMMREAMDMAREAQEMNRQRMQQMQREIAESYEGTGYAAIPTEDAPE